MSNSPVQLKQNKRSMSSDKAVPEEALPSESNWANKYQDFDIGKPIGYGSSAVVYEAIYKPLQKRVAIKMIDLDMFERNQIDELRRETALMALSKHTNVLKVYGSFVNGSKLYIVTPYLSAGSCLDIIKSYFSEGFEEISIATILRQALEGLVYLHKNGHIHRDMKAGNLLMDDQGTVLLADFGVSSSLTENSEVRKTFVGTPCWMAPEVMEQASYNYKADIWSFGITCIELATGRAPFAKYAPMKVLMMTMSNPPPTLDRDACKHKYTKCFKEMIDLCLQKDPTKRPTAEKLLLHPFFKQAKKKDFLIKSVLAYVPTLDQRPHKKLPQRCVSVITTDQPWDFSEDETKPTTVVTAKTAPPLRERSKSVVKFVEDPVISDVARPVLEKKHITFGEVVVKDVVERPPMIITASLNEIPTAPKPSRFVIGEHEFQSPPSSHSPPYTTPIDPNCPPLVHVSSASSSTQSSIQQDGAFKKGRFSVNQTPVSTRPTTPALDETPTTPLEPKAITRASSQESNFERKSRFHVNSEPTTQGIPLTRESSKDCLGKPSRFSIEKPETDNLPPECRKKGRFELTGGGNVNGPIEIPEKKSSPAISPSNSVSRGQANRLADPNVSQIIISHMETLLKQTEMQRNTLQGLATTLPVLYGSPSNVSRTLADFLKPNNVYNDDQRATQPVQTNLPSDILSTIDHLQKLLISSSENREKLMQENEALKKEIERLKTNN